MMASSSVIIGMQMGDSVIIGVDAGPISMESLPSDVALDILSRLPVESVFDCKLVCKGLLKLLRDRWNQFTKMHHRRQLQQLASYGDASASTGLLFAFEKDDEDTARLYYGDKYNSEMNIHEKFSYKTLQKTSVSFPQTFEVDFIIGSCNGLICLNKPHDGIPDPIHICNPNTGEYVNLPEYTLREKRYAAAYGFGYVHCMTNIHYKVVRIYYPYLDDDFGEGEVQVYTIGSGNGWRTVGRTSYMLFTPCPLGIFVDGALHWIDMKQILAFDLADEEFRLIQSPPCYDCFHDCFHTLQALRGNLCLCHQRNEEHLLDIWSLKRNTMDASWSRDFSIAYDSAKEIDGESQLIPTLVTKKNEVLFVDQGMIYIYDPKLTVVTKLWDVEKLELIGITAAPHMNSFVSLKALGEKSEIKKEAIERNSEDTDQSV